MGYSKLYFLTRVSSLSRRLCHMDSQTSRKNLHLPALAFSRTLRKAILQSCALTLRCALRYSICARYVLSDEMVIGNDEASGRVSVARIIRRKNSSRICRTARGIVVQSINLPQRLNLKQVQYIACFVSHCDSGRPWPKKKHSIEMRSINRLEGWDRESQERP